MAEVKVPRIKEFPNDGRFWRVDWLGALTPNPQITTEPHLQVIISPFLSNPADLPIDQLASTRATNAAQQTVIKIGVGQLPFIEIGSVWRDGIHQGIYAGTTERFNHLLISSESTTIISARHKEGDHYLIPYNYYRLGLSLDSQLVAVEYKDDPYGILIPAIELIRFYYAISTNLAHALFSGAFQHTPDLIIHTDRTWYRAEDDRVFLGLRQQVTDEEGWVVARILRSKTATKVCQQIYDGVIKNAVNNQYIQVTAGFPFTGSTNLKARVKKIFSPNTKKWRLLVLALEHCTAPMPYRELTVIRDNDGNKADPTTDTPDDQKKTYTRNSNNASTNKASILQSQEDTNAALSGVLLKVASNRFGVLENRKPDKPNKEQCEYRSGGLSHKDFAVDALGTGLGGYSKEQQAIQRANIAPEKDRRKAAAPSFKLFVAAIELLNRQAKISANIRQVGRALTHMPLTKPSEKRQWGYLSSETKQRRHVMIADIHMNGQFFNLIEFQQRETERCTACLVSTGNRKVTDLDLARLLFLCSSKNGVWKNIEIKGSELTSLKHTWADSQSLCNSVMGKLSP